MIKNGIRQIESISPNEYIDALDRIKPTELQWQMLRLHRAAPNHTLTARHLARGLGFSEWRGANLHYGRFAGKVCEELGVAPATKLSVLVEFSKAFGAEYDLRLRPAVIEALEAAKPYASDAWHIQEEFDNQQSLVEGASFLVRVNAFERNPVARQRCVEHHGLDCAVCGFNFGRTYGSSAEGFIQVHHLRPLATIREKYVIAPIDDLRPVCANCHAIIHMRRPQYSVEEVRNMLRRDVSA